MDKKYLIKLVGKTIGFSYLEENDSPMGVVIGKIYFENNISSGYEFFSEYCRNFNIPINEDIPKEKFISTQSIEDLTVFSEDGIEIKGVGVYVVGFEDEFQIEVFGVPYPFYGEEFPHHVEADENRFK